ncbi:MAG: FkbM family methyltransferase [Sandaracinaceae bacterium]|nr:FkbM family methyltransferase [Sandaracinaceae bacterium]
MVREVRDGLDRHQPPSRTPWGFVLAGHPAMADGTYEPVETALVRTLLGEVDALINVGANVGYYACHAASLGKSVVAIEPHPRNVHYLLANVRDNGWGERVEVFPVAVGASPGVLELYGGGTGASLVAGWAGTPRSYASLVPVLPLDRILEGRKRQKALIIADVEGAELMLLDGATATLRSTPRPLWLLEVAARVHQPEGTSVNPTYAPTFERFAAAGYQAFAISSAGTTPWSLDDVARVCAGAEPPSYNFLFRPAS